MNTLYDTEKIADSCAACGDEFVKYAGRYIFDDNSYCPTCWERGDVRMNLRKGSMNSSIDNKNYSSNF